MKELHDAERVSVLLGQCAELLLTINGVIDATAIHGL